MTYREAAVTFTTPSFPDPHVQAWAMQVYAWAQDLTKRYNALLAQTRLAQGAAMTAADGGTVDSGDATTDAVIENNRTRIAEIEVILQANNLAP